MCFVLLILAIVAIFSVSAGKGIDNVTVFKSAEMNSLRMCSTHQNVLDKTLEEFALFLMPPEHSSIFGMQKVQEIIRHLRKNRSDIDRIVLGGSMGKNTADHFPGISPPLEFDIFVYLNGILDSGRPHFWLKTVEEFKKIIEKWEKPQVEIVKETPFYLSVFVAGIKIDISPVANLKVNSFQKMIKMNKSVPFDILNPYENTQLAETVEKISSLANPIQQRRSFMRGFTEAHVKVFTHKIPQFSLTRNLIRISKFWGKQKVVKRLNSTHFNLVGFSSFIERVAVHAATSNFSISESTSSQKSESLSRGFSQFLKLLVNFNSLNVNHQNFDQDLNNFQNKLVVQSCHVPGPFVSDLVDPFSNYAMLERDPGKRKQVIEILITAANNSLKNFEKLQEKYKICQKQLCEYSQIDILNLFLEFPEIGKFSSC